VPEDDGRARRRDCHARASSNEVEGLAHVPRQLALARVEERRVLDVGSEEELVERSVEGWGERGRFAGLEELLER
jgi:hypothetical protein